MVKGKKEKKPKKEPEVEPFRPQRQPMEDPLVVYMQRLKEEEEMEKKRMKQRMEEKVQKEEMKFDKLRVEWRKKSREMKFEKPPPYQPLEPVKKSMKLSEWEQRIKKGTFFDDENTKAVMEKARNQTRMLKYMKVLQSCGLDDDFGMKMFGFNRNEGSAI